MNDVMPARATWHEQRPVALTGLTVFAAGFAALHFFTASALSQSALTAAVVAMLAMAITALVASWRYRTRNGLMTVALNNMTQGICMFDKNERLVVCNHRYIEIYKLSPEISAPGVTIADMLKYRAANGTFLPDPEKYRRELVSAMAAGKVISSEVKSADGRIICVINRAMPQGGWVGSHEDITDRREAERERAAMSQQQEQRTKI